MFCTAKPYAQEALTIFMNMKNAKRLAVIKYALYAVLLLALYVLQTVPGLFVLFGVKPILVAGAAVAVAMHEGEFIGCVYGVGAGILCDMGGFSLFGFNAFVLGACCLATGLLVIYLMRRNIPNCILFTLFTLLLRGSLEYLFAFGMWGYDNVWKAFVYNTLPVAVYSTAVAPLLYLVVRLLHRRFRAGADLPYGEGSA